MRHFWTLLAAGVIAWSLGMGAHWAWGHSWYDHDCCSDQDCHPIESCDELHELPKGSYEWDGFIIRKERVRPSKDAHCHVCTTSTRPYGLCAYIQSNV